ncbi:MAG: RDD family protein, partial [Jiangellaceae bacterium]
MSDLVTGEAVPLELRLAKLPTRALAFAIDLAVLAIGSVLVAAAATVVLPSVDAALASALVLVGVVLVYVGIPVLVETLSRGRSLGKLVLGLRVVRDDGGPVRFRHALTRGLSGVFVDFYLTSGAGAVICSLLNERGKRVGDILAGTVVIRERVPRTAAPLPTVPAQLAGWAATLELSRLPAGLALNARGYLTRYQQLSPAIREQMGAELATEVAGVISPPAPPGTPAWAYLAAVLAERSRRESLRLARAARPDQPSAASTA